MARTKKVIIEDENDVFYEGDQLKVVDNKDAEDFVCDLDEDEIVTVLMGTSKNYPLVCVKKSNGDAYRVNRTRFKLYSRAIKVIS